MYKIILVPLDQSKRAEAIFPHVEELARCSDGSVVLMHVIELSSITFDVYGTQPDLDQIVITELTRSAEEYMAECEKRFQEKGIKVKTRIVNGPIVDTIIKVAKEESADLIAMASHGRGGLAYVFYGSVAAGILHRADRPLLLIRSMDEHAK